MTDFCSTPGHGDRPGRPFPRGSYCAECMPVPVSAPGRYCMAVCYCGTCPHRGVAMTPITPNVIDFRAVASGKRRAGLGEYREAQAQVKNSSNEKGERA